MRRLTILFSICFLACLSCSSPALAAKHHKTTLKQVRQAVHAEAPYVEHIKCSREGRRFYCSAQMEIESYAVDGNSGERSLCTSPRIIPYAFRVWEHKNTLTVRYIKEPSISISCPLKQDGGQ